MKFPPVRCVFGIAITISVTVPSQATILIDDGTTLSINSSGNAADDFDTDYQATAGGGVLEIDSSGNLIFSNSRTISNTHGEGTTRVLGTLTHAASSASQIDSEVQLESGGEIKSNSSNLLLRGGGNYEGRLNAADGTIVFNGGTHVLDGVELTGANYARVASGEVQIMTAVGPSSGAANGGFSIDGGAVVGFSGLGGSFGHLSADHGVFGSGSTTGAILRYTGTLSKTAASTLTIASGSLTSEGTMNQDGGIFDIDPTAAASHGNIFNKGTWNLGNLSVVKSTAGDGTFSNSGLLSLSSGIALFNANLANASGSEVRIPSGGRLTLQGGGNYPTGSLLNLDGTLALDKGSHLLAGAQITGSGGVELGPLFLGGTMSVLGPTGPTTGAATGGFSMISGTITGLGGIGGGGSQPIISVDHGRLLGGIIGSATLRYTGSAEIMTNSLLSVEDGAIINDGVLAQADGASINVDPLTTSGGGSLVNRGTWNFTASSLILNINGEGQFINEGGVTHDGANAISHIAAKFVHKAGATLRASNGSAIHLDGGGSYASGSTLDADGGEIFLESGSHLLSGPTLTGTGHVHAGPLGDVGLLMAVGPETGPATGGFALSGGTVTDLGGLIGGASAGPLSADHGFLAAGRINGATLRFTGNSVKESNSLLRIDSGKLINEGTLEQRTIGLIDLDIVNDDNSGTIENSGTWNITGQTEIRATHGGGEIRNSGLFTHSASLGSFIHPNFTLLEGGEIRVNASQLFLIGGGSYSSGSLLNAAAGEIRLSAGNHSLFGTTLAGASNVVAAGGAVTIDLPVGPATGPATGGFSVEGGTVGPGIFGGGSTAELSADHGVLADGAIGSASLRYTGELRKKAATELSLRGHLRNEGTMFQEAAGNIDLDFSDNPGGGTIINTGTWTMDGGCFVKNTHGEGIFYNSGTLVNNTGSNTIRAAVRPYGNGVIRSLAGQIYLEGGGTYDSGSVLDADGGVNVAGGFIFLNGGTHEFNGGTLTGTTFTAISAGWVNVNQNVGATTGPATGGFALYGGIVGGSAMISADHGFFYDSAIADSVVLRYTGQSHKQDGTTTTMFGGTIRNDGVFGQGTNGAFELDASADTGSAGTISNNGVWNIGGSNTFSNTHGGGLFENSGEIRQTGGTVVMHPAFHNDGGVHVTGGSFSINGGSTHQPSSLLDANGGEIYLNGSGHVFHGGGLAGASSVTFSSGSTAAIEGNVGPTSGSAAGGISLTGGTLQGDSMISADHGYISSGTIFESMTLRFTGPVLKEGNTHLGMSGGTLRNDGVLTHKPGGSIDTDNTSGGSGGTLVNNGTWNLQGSSVISNSYGAGSFSNNGDLNQLAGGDTIHASFNNQPGGALNSTGGYISLQGGGTQLPGSTLNANGGDIYFNGGTHQWSGGGLEGSSFVYTSAGTVTLTGTVGAESGPATGGFGISGGTVNGTGTLSAARGYFSSGSIGGDVTLRFTTSFVKADNSHLQLNGGTIRNDGVFTQSSGGNFDLDSQSSPGAGKLINGGEWNISGSNVYSNSYGAGVIENFGNFNQLGGENNIYPTFTNHGVLRATAGNIYLRGGHTSMPGSVLDANGGAIYLLGGSHEFGGASLTGSSFIYASSGNVTLNSDSGPTTGPATGGFGVTGAHVSGSGMLSVQRGYFSSGLISGSLTLRLTGTSVKQQDTHLQMNGGIIWNQGTFNQASGGNIDTDSASGGGAGLLRNSGTWNINGSTTLSNSYQGGVFENSGLLSQNSGASNIHAAFKNLTGGVLEIKASYLQFLGGGLHEAGSTLLANGGDFYFGGGTHTFAGNTITGPNYVYLSGATIVLTADVNATSGPGTGGFGITAGTLSGGSMLSMDRGHFGSGLINGTATMRITGTALKVQDTHLQMDGGTIWNQGTFNQASGGNLDTDSGSNGGAGVLRNSGTWNLNGSSTLSNSYQNGIFENLGSLKQNSGTTIFLPTFNNRAGGELETKTASTQFRGGGLQEAGSTLHANGGDIYFNGGAHTFAGNTVTGPNHVYLTAGNIVLSTDVNATSGPATGGFGVAGGTLGGSAMLSVDHGYFSSGLINGTLTMRLTGTSVKIQDTHLQMDGGTIWNQGTFNAASGANFDTDCYSGGGAGLLSNTGVWNLNGTSTISNSYGSGVFENSGSLKQNSGNTNVLAIFNNRSGGMLETKASYTQLRGGGLQEAGSTLHANGGDIYFSGGTHTFAGNSVTGPNHVYLTAGNIVVTTDVNAASGPATGGFGVAGGTLGGTAVISAERAYFSSGFITGSVEVRLTGTSTKQQDTHLQMDGGTIRNEGTFNQSSGGNLDLDSNSGGGAGVLRNSGTWKVFGSCTISNSYQSGSIENSGLWETVAGTSTFHPPLSNSGTLRVSTSTLYLQVPSTHSGSIVANGGLVFNGGSHTVSGAAASLSGNGSLYGSVTLSNGAVLAPGDGVGTLAFYGGVAFTSGAANPSLRVELGEASDAITLGNGGSLALGTNLTNLEIVANGPLAYGRKFRIVAAGSSTGTFSGRFHNAADGAVLSISQNYLQIAYDGAGKFIDLTVLSPYQAWALEKGVSNGGFNADSDGDGISNGLEYIFGGEPNPGSPFSDSNGLLPAAIIDGNQFRFIFRRTAASAWLAPVVEYAPALDLWKPTVHGEDGVEILTTNDFFGDDIDRVEVKIPRSLGADGSLFGRLRVEQP